MNQEKAIFVDTSAFIALRVQSDVNYHNAQRFLTIIQQEKLKLYATNFILDEVYTYFCKSHAVAIEMAQLILNNPLIQLHRISGEDENKAWKILQDFEDKTFSYTDATSFAFMDRMRLSKAFAFDAHFKQYGCFVILP